MVRDWHTYLRANARALPGGELPEKFWREFQELADSSAQAGVLRVLIAQSAWLPASARHILAMGVARLLEPIDWPPAWDAPRKRLGEGLWEWLYECDVTRENSLAGLLMLGDDEEFVGWVTALRATERLLEAPCRRDDLRSVAVICNVGTKRCVSICRTRWAQRNIKTHKKLLVPKVMFETAYKHYADAARALNVVLGERLFIVQKATFGEAD